VPDLRRTKYHGWRDEKGRAQMVVDHVQLALLLAELCVHEELGNSGDPDVRINDLTARVRRQIGWRDAN